MSESSPPASRQVFTVGHSNHTMEAFLSLLRGKQIDVLVDLRSSPYSAYTTHFNADQLRAAIKAAGIQYVYMGKELGGRPDDPSFYDQAGHVLYWRIADSPLFREGIERLLKGLDAPRRLALMCSEEDPTECHRRLLVSRVLLRSGVDIQHIRGDGTVQAEAEVARLQEHARTGGQQFLFPAPVDEKAEWKSTQSVSGRKPPSGSSAH